MAALFVGPSSAVEFVSDCKSAVAEMANLAASSHYSRAWAGRWRQVDPRAVRAATYVKAHQAAPPVGSTLPAHVAAYGNGLADALAGRRSAEGAPVP